MSDQLVTVRIPTSRRRMLLVVLTTAALVAPTAVWAAHRFNDVADSNVFHDDIAWMADNGVTAGCNPPANDEFCPDDVVTREQMAAFMRRLDSQDVFATFDEMDGLLPIATVAVDDAGVLTSQSSRAPVASITSRDTGADFYELEVRGLDAVDDPLAVCTAVANGPGSLPPDADINVTARPRVGGDDRIWIYTTDISTGNPANSAFACAIYG